MDPAEQFQHDQDEAQAEHDAMRHMNMEHAQAHLSDAKAQARVTDAKADLLNTASACLAALLILAWVIAAARAIAWLVGVI